MTFCTTDTLVNQGPHGWRAAVLYCRSWSCPECAPKRAAQLRALAMSGDPDTFITLTSQNRPGLTPELAAAELARAWRIIVKRHRRRSGLKKFDYLAVFEATKKGWPHLHILARSKWIDQRWLSRQMQEITGSPVCWVERIQQKKKAAAYIAKYIGKDPHRFGTCKRYWATPRYDRSEKPWERDSGTWYDKWDTRPIGLAAWADGMAQQGYRIAQDDSFIYAYRTGPP